MASPETNCTLPAGTMLVWQRGSYRSWLVLMSTGERTTVRKAGSEVSVAKKRKDHNSRPLLQYNDEENGYYSNGYDSEVWEEESLYGDENDTEIHSDQEYHLMTRTNMVKTFIDDNESWPKLVSRDEMSGDSNVADDDNDSACSMEWDLLSYRECESVISIGTDVSSLNLSRLEFFRDAVLKTRSRVPTLHQHARAVHKPVRKSKEASASDCDDIDEYDSFEQFDMAKNARGGKAKFMFTGHPKDHGARPS